MLVLLVEDDESLAIGLCKALRAQSFVVNHVATGRAALHVVETEAPDIVILDLGLPDLDGLDVLKSIKQRKHSPAVLILTARASVDDRVTGLDRGADDYLPKPFEISELIARLRVIERRMSSVANSIITVGNVSLDTISREVKLGQQVIDIPRREYTVLKALMENENRVQTREQLESKLYSWGEEVASNAIEVHIHHLRKKFSDTFIKTIRGVGYTIRSQ